MNSVETELLTAFELHSPDRIRAVLENGFDVGSTINGQRPIDALIEMYLRSDRFPSCLRLLLERGATLADLAALEPDDARALMTVTGGRTVYELRGISCMPLELMEPTRKGIAVTRSFGNPVTTWTEMREAIASYATRAAEKMRRYKVAADNLFVFIHTSTFNKDSFYSNGASARFAATTNDTGEVVALAVRLGERLWRDGFRYSKCGVMISELLPEAVRQPALWGDLDRERRERAWKTVDQLNATLGRGTVRILSAGAKDAAWKLRAEHLSPRWTTRWDELPRIKLGSVGVGGNADPQGSEGRWPEL